MEHSKTSDEIKIPALGIGTAGLCENNDLNDSVNAIKAAIELGITHIDTAEGYANGLAEKAIGVAIKNVNRNELFITTKVSKDNLSYDSIISSAKNSLKRLGTDYINLYLIHAPNPKFPLKETIRAMDFLIEKKLVKSIGVSNFSVELLKEAQSHSKNKIVANQVEYNLLERKPESGLLQHCQKNDITLIAYTPLARGLLAKAGFNALIDSLSKKYNKTPAQISLNWLLSHKNVVVIPKAKDAEHLKENLGALSWQLEKNDIEMLDKEKFKMQVLYLQLKKFARILDKKLKILHPLMEAT